MCLVGLIGSRMDVWAVLYGGWLCVLWSSSRDQLSRLWKWFSIFIVIAIPFQYLLVVGLLPEICVVYPWMGFNEVYSFLFTFIYFIVSIFYQYFDLNGFRYYGELVIG